MQYSASWGLLPYGYAPARREAEWISLIWQLGTWINILAQLGATESELTSKVGPRAERVNTDVTQHIGL